ncbi:MAG TPA: hypothetical protein VF867_20075 [Arthrobacter sp.]
MNWFGEPWPSASFRAAVCSDESLHVPFPPSDEECILCGHSFVHGDRGVLMPHLTADLTSEMHYCHIECLAGNIGELNQ